jgi:hypothetical protein
VSADCLARSAVAAALFVAATSEARTQSLAEIARIEAERRAKVTAPGKVYTNADLIPDFTKPVPPPDQAGAPPETPAAPGDVAAPSAAAVESVVPTPADSPPGVTPRDRQEPQPADDKDETYWRNQAQLIRGRLASQNAQIDQLRARERSFAAGVESAEKLLVQQTLQKAVDDLAFLNEEWLRFERSARDRKVPEHWIR